MKMFLGDGDRRVAYADDGKGMAVYLVPGSRGNHSAYDPQVPALVEAGYRAVRIDRPGRGESNWGKWRPSSRDEAGEGWSLLESLGVERAVLVGRSSGTGVIRRMYLTEPDRVIGIVSVDSNGFGKLYDPTPEDQRTDLPIDSFLSPRFDPETVALYHKNKVALRKIGALWAYPSDMETKLAIEWKTAPKEWKKVRKSLPPPGPRGVLVEPSPDDKKWVRVPLLVFAAGRGRVGPDDPEAVELAKRLPAEDSTLVVIKNSGHFVNTELADLFNRKLLEFLARLA